MLPEKRILGFVDASRKIVRSPEVGVESLHQRAMSADDIFGLGAGLKAKDLVGLLLRHWPARRTALPRCRVGLRVLPPGGGAVGGRRSRYAANKARLSSSISASNAISVGTSSASSCVP